MDMDLRSFRYCRSAMAQKLFSTGPGIWRRAKRKETIDGLDRTSCDSLFHSEMVLTSREERELIAIKTRRKYSECVRVRVSGVMNGPAKCRRRQRVVIEDRSVTPEWPRVVDLRHRSAGGVLLLSPRSWSIHRLLGRPGRRFQLWSGRSESHGIAERPWRPL